VPVFKTRPFAKFADRESIPDTKLCETVAELESGNADADYGSGLYKQRISRRGQGKSGGYRSIIYFRKGDRAFFAYGFAKKDRENLSPVEVKTYKALAKIYLAASDDQIAHLVKVGEITEVQCNGES
jgi:hypothetical protein